MTRFSAAGSKMTPETITKVNGNLIPCVLIMVIMVCKNLFKRWAPSDEDCTLNSKRNYTLCVRKSTQYFGSLGPHTSFLTPMDLLRKPDVYGVLDCRHIEYSPSWL